MLMLDGVDDRHARVEIVGVGGHDASSSMGSERETGAATRQARSLVGEDEVGAAVAGARGSTRSAGLGAALCLATSSASDGVLSTLVLRSPSDSYMRRRCRTDAGEGFDIDRIVARDQLVLHQFGLHLDHADAADESALCGARCSGPLGEISTECKREQDHAAYALWASVHRSRDQRTWLGHS